MEAVSDGLDMIKIGNYEVPSRGYVGRFNFKGGDQQKFVRICPVVSVAACTALTLKQGANVLLLDEPSNDLDVETLRSLEEALLDFPGAAIVISHDRWFLDRVATHILSYEDDGSVVFFEGNYTEYEADRKKRLGDAASQPTASSTRNWRSKSACTQERSQSAPFLRQLRQSTSSKTPYAG